MAEENKQNEIPARNTSGVADVGGKTEAGGVSAEVVETYAEDMAKVIADDRGGLIKKIIHQSSGNEIEKINLSPESKKNQFFMIAGILLIFVTLTILFFFLFKEDLDTVEIEKQFIPLIFNDKSEFIEVTGFEKGEMAETISGVIDKTTLKTGEVEGIYLTENKMVVGFKRFIELIKGNFISPTTEDGVSFVSDNFLLGIVNNETGPARPPGSGTGGDFFILFKVRSVTDVFNSMRAWEDKMFFDLHGFFGVSISSETSYLLTKDFNDGFVENKNARILYEGETKKIVIMYVFADDNSVVVTNTPEVVREIISRLASGQIEK